ncbi:MAG: hypothetical protein SFX72_06365 [Isosphaeraceae bacterium]|nr:hypothetical protein [Isosphaeraceae bacterium]
MHVLEDRRSMFRHGLPWLLLGVSLAWILGIGRGPTVQAQAPATPHDASGTIAFTSTSPNQSTQFLYLIDTKAQSFAVYRVEPSGNPRGSGTVKLEAARRYRWDLQLTEYNNLAPEVRAVESMVKAVSNRN